MQALSLWPPPIGDCCRIPPVASHLGHSYCVVIARKRRNNALFRGNSRDFGDGFSDKSLRFDFDKCCLSGCSRDRVFHSPQLGNSIMRVSVHVGCPSVEETVGDDLGAEDMASIALNTTVDCLKIDGLEAGVEKAVKKEKENARVDVLALAHSLQSAKSADDVECVMKQCSELPLQIYSSLIRGFGQEKNLEAAVAIVDWLKKKRDSNEGFEGPNLFVYNSLLGAVKQSGKYELVDNVMNDLTEDGMTPNIVTYNTLMAIYMEQGRALEALSLFDEIQTKGLVPSPVSYSTALLAYRRTEDAFGALRFFLELREKFAKGEILMSGHKEWEGELDKLQNFTSRICFQVMRQWIVKNENRTTNVLKLLIELDKAELPPTIAEHEKLVWACTREEHYTVAKELYVRIREQQQSDISLSVCNHVIWLMGKAKKWWAALEIYENLLDKGPKPNNLSYELVVSHFNILLTAARKRGIWRWGVRLLNKMESKGLKPGSKEWNAVLVACSKASETQAAVQIFKRMVEQGEKPTVISYGALLSALEKGKLYEEAIRVWDHMLKVGVKPNLYAYTIMASIYVGLGRFKVVEMIIQEMITTENNPTVVTFNAIISGCARNGWGGVAYEWFHRMKGMNVEPNKVTYEMLIEALTVDAKPKLAYELYLRARNECLSLSTKSYDAVIECSMIYGATIDMGLLGPRPLEEKKKVHTRKDLSEFCKLADVPRRSEPFIKQELYSKRNL